MPQQIVVLSGPLAGNTFPLGAAPLSFGRTPENNIVLASPLASRRHAELRADDAGYLIQDLGSSNGTFVNGQRVQAQRLQPGDVIAIGDETFRFDAPAIDKTLLAAPVPQIVTQLADSAPPPQPPPPVWAAPANAAPQSPLPPLPQSPVGNDSATPLPLPAMGGPAVPPAPARSRLPLFILIGALFACVLLAGLVGGLFLITRSGGIGGNPGGPTATDAPAVQAGTPAAPAPTRAPVADAAAWTVLVYLDGDNNLESDALTDFVEMADVGSSDQVKIVVQLDRISSSEGWDDTSAGDWDGAKRFLVERGMEPTADAAIEDLGERNFGDPDELAEFVEWGITNYPAERYALILWDHGASWLGIASDDSSDGDTLSMPELGAALETARQRTAFGSLDLIGFDACLMAQLDVLMAVEPYAKVAVASAELEPNQGWAWDTWLAALADDPAQDALSIAPVIVDTYMDSYRGSDADEVTLSAFDLTKLAPLTQQVDSLASAMLGDMSGSYTAIGQARSFVDVYAPSYPEEFNAVDLGHFAQLLPEQGATGDIADAADAVSSALGQARIANGAGQYHRNSSGLSIYFPQLEELYIDDYERGSPLPRATQWDEFLQSYHGAGATAVTQPTISNLLLDNATVSVNAPGSLTGTLSGSDIAYVFSFIGTPNASRDTVDLLYVDFVYPPGAVPNGDAPSWGEGEFDLQLSWDATNWYLNNGQDEIEVLLGPVKYGSAFYGVEGVYTSKATGDEIDAGLIFSVSQGQGTLARIWGFPKSNGKQEPQPYELTPEPGDSFTAYTRSYTDNGGSLEPARLKGQTITFGDQPLTANVGPTLSGDYVMGFLVRDIAGNFSYDYVDVTVDNSGANNQPAPPASSSQPGSQAGYLAYENSSLGFGIEHPQDWEAFDSGRDKIVFYNPSANDNVYVSVDVYSLGLGSAAEANSDILRQLIDLAVDTVEGEVRIEEADFTAAGQDARKVEYAYRNQAGEMSYVVAVAVTSPTSDRTYLLTLEAPEAGFDTHVDRFNTMLDTLVLE